MSQAVGVEGGLQPGSPEAIRQAEEHAIYAREELRRAAFATQPRPPAPAPEIQGVYVPKHVRIYAELARTICAAISATGTMVILLHVYGVM